MNPVNANYPSTDGAECPFPLYRYWREEAPVYRLPDRPDVYVVSRYEDVKQVARDPATFSSVGSRTRLNGFGFVGEPTHGKAIVESDPPGHKAKHDLAFDALKPGRIKEHAGWIEAIVDGLIDRFIDRGGCEFVGEFARRLPVAVTARFFGIPDQDLPLLEQWADLEVSGLSWMPPDRQERQRRDSVEMGAYLERLVRDRYEHPGADFVSQLILLQAERDGEPDLGEILAISGNVLAGGAATTQHMLGGARPLPPGTDLDPARPQRGHASRVVGSVGSTDRHERHRGRRDGDSGRRICPDRVRLGEPRPDALRRSGSLRSVPAQRR
jgi:cytochrome P450